jgi:hypothetical protein
MTSIPGDSGTSNVRVLMKWRMFWEKVMLRSEEDNGQYSMLNKKTGANKLDIIEH